MAKKITAIEGIGPAMETKLFEAQITNVEKLLEKGCTKAGRKELAELTGLSESKILTWVNMADLFRIKGIGGQFAELLKATGVDTVKELRNRNPENLYEALVKTQDEKHITKAVPALSQVMNFIAQAKELEPKITY